VRALILGTSPEGYISLCNVIAKAERPDYETIKAPVLLLAGGDDKTSPITGCEAILEAYGTSKEKKELKLLEGVGHWHCVEAPEEVGRLAAQFIKSIA
jgi:pimeloyl-ACP methyl ester carboxylesterase